MNEENKNPDEQKEAPKIKLEDVSKGTLELAEPIRAKSKDIRELHYDFGKLTGWEYAEAMDSDANARNVFVVTKKQAISLFAAAAAKLTDDMDAIDIKTRIGLADAQRAAQVATLFLSTAAREAGKNIYGE